MSVKPVAISDVGTKLLLKGATLYETFISISSAPSPKGAPEALDATTLDSPTKQNIKGRADSPVLAFEFNHTDDNMTTALTACTGGEKEFLLLYPDKTGWVIKGEADATVNDVAINGVIKATFSIFPTSVTYKKASETTALVQAA